MPANAAYTTPTPTFGHLAGGAVTAHWLAGRSAHTVANDNPPKGRGDPWVQVLVGMRKISIKAEVCAAKARAAGETAEGFLNRIAAFFEQIDRCERLYRNLCRMERVDCFIARRRAR